MNYLAHLFLSCDSEEKMIGNFITDQITLKESKRYDALISEGIQLHRAIDTFTDNHPQVKKVIKILRPTQGKYAPVVVDIYFDYLLYKSWDNYSHRPFEHFSNSVYSMLPKYLELMPVRIHHQVTNMVKMRWLDVYTTIDGLNSTFHRLQKRTRFINNLTDAPSFLSKNQNQLSDHFNEFFPDVIKYVELKCNC